MDIKEAEDIFRDELSEGKNFSEAISHTYFVMGKEILERLTRQEYAIDATKRELLFRIHKARAILIELVGHRILCSSSLLESVAVCLPISSLPEICFVLKIWLESLGYLLENFEIINSLSIPCNKDEIKRAMNMTSKMISDFGGHKMKNDPIIEVSGHTISSIGNTFAALNIMILGEALYNEFKGEFDGLFSQLIESAPDIYYIFIEFAECPPANTIVF